MNEYPDGWAPRGIRVVLIEDDEIRHCAHCDRYDDDSPLVHPSCIIVKKPHQDEQESMAWSAPSSLRAW